ncbi:spore coat protein A [Streptacidiphilus sp. MAP12-20]|uniref:multicopper oxidase family protein n=1 Tax=Streptacidiphilus sp. MAP12-20 TaxID=3156299 RepID=UPI003517B3AA
MADSDISGSVGTSGSVTRRTLFRAAAAGGVVTAVGVTGAASTVGRAGGSTPGLIAATAGPNPLPGGSLDPVSVPKYQTELRRLPVMPCHGSAAHGDVDVYEIVARQFTQQILPRGYPRTTVWGYGAAGAPGSFHAPAHTIEARVGRPVRVTWTNGLADGHGRWLPHLFTVDPSLHWANPGGGLAGRDSRPTFSSTPLPYTGPVPLVTHLHGAHVTEESDGYPEAWTLPDADGIPAGYATTGSWYDRYRAEAQDRYGVHWRPGSSVYQYSNDQRAAALWYHDHVLGMTRLNVQAGLAGMYLLRGGPADLPAGVLPSGDAEIPMVIQDRCFNTDGTLFFPDSRTFFGDTTPGGPWLPTSDVPPFWNPESFGNTMLVNGSSWPVWHASRRRYRLRVVNSCNARTLVLKVVADPLAKRPATAALPIWQIGSDGGFLPAPVELNQALIAPAERADLILDFTAVPAGTTLYVINEGPDVPYHGGVPDADFVAADHWTSGQVMKIVVGYSQGHDASVPPAHLQLPRLAGLGTPGQKFTVSLNEGDSSSFPGAPIVGALGTLNPDGTGAMEMWSDPVSVKPVAGTVGEWDLVNLTVDGHPIHIHQTQFQVVSRTAANGTVRGPEAWETGYKDTVLAYPGETTRLKARFDLPGRYVYHCHILDHEDNEMMRPFDVQA